MKRVLNRILTGLAVVTITISLVLLTLVFAANTTYIEASSSSQSTKSVTKFISTVSAKVTNSEATNTTQDSETGIMTDGSWTPNSDELALEKLAVTILDYFVFCKTRNILFLKKVFLEKNDWLIYVNDQNEKKRNILWKQTVIMCEQSATACMDVVYEHWKL